MIMIPFLLPLDKQENIDAMDAILGQGFTKEFPIFMKSMAEAMLVYKDDLEGWLIWIKEGVDYILGEREDYPTMEGAPLDKIRKIVALRMNSALTQAEKIKKEKLIEKEQQGTFLK